MATTVSPLMARLIGPAAVKASFAPARVSDKFGGFILDNPTGTLSLLKDISNGIAASIFQQSRDDEGTQGPLPFASR